MRTPTVAVIVGLALTFAAATAEAQWEVSTSEPDDFTGAVIRAVYVLGESGNIFLSVYCDNSVVLRLSGRSRGGIFHHGKVETRWDDGEVEVFEFEDQDERLSLNGGRSNRLINGFRQRNLLRIRVTKFRDELVSDRFNLAGASRALDDLRMQCGR